MGVYIIVTTTNRIQMALSCLLLLFINGEAEKPVGKDTGALIHFKSA